MAEFVAWVMTDRVGSKMERKFTIADEDLEGLDEAEINRIADEDAWNVVLQSMIEWGWRRA